MEMHQETKNTANVSPVIPNVVMPFPSRITQQSNDANELPIELTNTTGTNILELNEDCLLEIFSVKSLTMMDLCSLAETCTSFQQITRRVFPKDLKINILIEGPYRLSSRHYLNSGDHRHDDAERISKNFGSILTEIAIASSESPNLVLHLLANYCINSLDSLKIETNCENQQISEEVTVRLQPIFKRLQILHVTGVKIVDNKCRFANFDSLIELRVGGVTNCRALLANTFPKLERFIYFVKVPFRDYDNDRISTFISRHPRLKKLHLGFACCILQIIANICKDLEELSIEMRCNGSCSLQPLQALTSLKILKICNANCENLKFLSGLPQLRELHLDYCHKSDDDFVGQFAILTQLTKLHIYKMYIIGASDVVEIIKHLENLEEFSVDESLDENTFSEIVDVVKGRPDVLTLKCKFEFNWKNCDDDEKVKLLPFRGRLF